MRPLVIRADAGPQIGLGHAMRCLALGQQWKIAGGKVSWIGQAGSSLEKRLLEEGFDPVVATDPADLTSLLLHVRAEEVKPWVVLDGYHFTHEDQRAIRETGSKLLVLDDALHLPSYSADVILNQNLHAERLTYPSELQTTHLLGTRYALLRQEYLDAAGPRTFANTATRVLITMGGADPENTTLKVIHACERMNRPDLELRVIVGSVNPHLPKLEKAVGSGLAIHLLVDPPRVSEVMTWADVAITAGGSTCWELALLGVPSLVLVLADNQAPIAAALAEAGAALHVGRAAETSIEEIITPLAELLDTPETRRAMSTRARMIVDGRGAERVLDTLRGLA